MSKQLPLTLFLILSSFHLVFSQDLIDSEYLGFQTGDNLAAQYGFNIFDFDVDHYKIEYTTLDVQGVLDTASGLLSIPEATNKAFPLLCYQHGTIGSKTDVPSNLQGGYQAAEVWAGVGYITFAPDFLGLGESRGFHPYVHRHSEASAAIDMRAAVITFLNNNDIHFNNQFFITGYSQGGHAAAALQRELEENYSSTIPVTASAPMSGPYSISGVMNDFMLSEAPYNFVAYLPYTILSYQTVYGNLFNNLEDTFKPDYAVIIEEFYNGNITLDNLNQTLMSMLTQDFGGPITIKMLQDSVIANVSNNPNHPFNIALRDNDVHDWAPQAPTRLYYCQADDQVPFMNAVVADSVMNALGAIDLDALNLNSDFDHGECVTPAIFAGYIFFGTFQQIDDLTSTEQLAIEDNLSIFPNPASDVFFIKNQNEEGFLQLFNSNGSLLLEEKITEGLHEVSTEHLPKGVYWVRVKFQDALVGKKVVIR